MQFSATSQAKAEARYSGAKQVRTRALSSAASPTEAVQFNATSQAKAEARYSGAKQVRTRALSSAVSPAEAVQFNAVKPAEAVKFNVAKQARKRARYNAIAVIVGKVKTAGGATARHKDNLINSVDFKIARSSRTFA
jgi:hypothetical protein